MIGELRRDEKGTRFAILLALAKLFSKGPANINSIYSLIEKEFGRNYRTKVSVYTQLKKLVKEGFVIETLEDSTVKVETWDDRNGVIRKGREKSFVRRIKEKHYHLVYTLHPEYVVRAFLFIWGSGTEEDIENVKIFMNTAWYVNEVSYLSGILDQLFHSEELTKGPNEIERAPNGYVLYDDGTFGYVKKGVEAHREGLMEYLSQDPTIVEEYGILVRREPVPDKEIAERGPFSKFRFDERMIFRMLSTFPDCAYYLFSRIHMDGKIIPEGGSRSDIYYNYLKAQLRDVDRVKFMNELYSKIKIENAVIPEDFKLFYIFGDAYDRMVSERSRWER